MARGRRKSESGNSSDSSSSSSGSNSSSSSESSDNSSRETSPNRRGQRKIDKNGRAQKGSSEVRSKQRSSERNRERPRSPSGSPPSNASSSPEHPSGKAKPRSPSAAQESLHDMPKDTHMPTAQKGRGTRSEDELSIGAGASDDEYQDELVQEADRAVEEIPKKTKSRREDLSSGEVTPEDGDSDDSYSWRENRVKSMLQSHVQKPSNDGTRRESYDRYDSDHEGDQQFRSIVGTTITRPGHRYSDSDSGEITDSEDEKVQDRRKSSRDKYGRRSSSPKRRTNRDEKRRNEKSSTDRRSNDRDNADKSKENRSEHESGRDRKRTRRRSRDGSKERTKEPRKDKRREDKDDDQYEDAKVKFRKRVWDRKEEESKEKKRTHEPPSPDMDKEAEINKENEAPPPPAKKKKEENILTRTGGAYIPPAKLRMMQEQITDKTSEAYQRMSWEALKKSINGLINKINVPNIGMIVQELLQLNIVRGRGLWTRSIITAQTASPTFTHVYAALVAVINTKFPQNGELLLRRLIINFKKGYRRNDKTLCLSATRFIAHLVNQQVAHEIIALEILTLLLENVTDDSVEVAVGFVKECGQKLQELSPRGINAIFERMRSILHEAQIDKRVQYMVEVVFANRKDGFKDYPSVVQELDLVEESDQFTHMMTLEENYQDENVLNVFKMDPEYLENEEKYKAIKKEILDEGSDDSDSDGESGEASSSDSDEEKEEEKMEIIDQTETNLVALRRTIYLTIQSSLDFEECAHKMLKMEFKPGQEHEVCMMILDCCAQQRTYEKFFGLLAQRFCQLKREYVAKFEEIFPEQYSTCHRLDTNKLRNVAKLFAHILYTDAISWTVLETIHMNEEETTSSSRIFVKIMFLELSEFMGLPKLNDRLQDKTLMPYFEGLLPRDNPANTRFAINFFTTIGLGGLTDDLRDHLKNVQKQIMQQRQPVLPSDSSSESSSESESSSSSSSSSDSSSDISSDSSSDKDKSRKKKKKKTKKGKEAKAKSSARKESSREKNSERNRDEEKSKRKEQSVATENSSRSRTRRDGARELEENNRTRRNDREFAENIRTRRNGREFEGNDRTRRNERELEENNRSQRNERGFEENNRTRRNDREFEENYRTRRNDREFEENSKSRRNERDREVTDRRGIKQNDLQANHDDRDQRLSRKDNGNRDKSRVNNDHIDRKKKQNAKQSKQQQESESDEESSSSSSEEESSSSSSSSSESESSEGASPPPPEKQGRQDRPREDGRVERDARENFSDKENQRQIRQRTRTNSDNYQKFNESARDYHRDKPNDYADQRQGRGDWETRQKRDDQFERPNVRNQRTRYNSRGEDDYVPNARNREYNRHERMEVDGYDRRNDRGRRYESDKGPRYNDRGGRYESDKGSRYNRY